MTMIDEIIVREAGRSAHEINRRVREIERNHVLLQMMPYAEREVNDDAPRPLKDLVQSNGATTSPSSPSEKHGWRVLGGMMGPVQ